jgi:putative transposase
MAVKRRRLGSEGWRTLLDRFATSGLTAVAFCRREGVSPASLYRWRALIGDKPARRTIMAPFADAPESIDFVDLGCLGERAASNRLDLRLDLGGGLTLHLVRD